ncbi:amino acid ABC transporter substrate-binding protein [Inquilinus limosus]|uniref:Amino acid ABC transporter substrate-binding protein n=1 Tax=Inquilinus limosus TaxID=171674 RepID=A0A211Z3Q0_9PROT|nr:amino acid ABC transporter substrate-binding protein [Inquilinus limosus]OWJ59880.1 amino acid ABC transporter substrate-binding protein [Inquilinus limosus]
MKVRTLLAAGAAVVAAVGFTASAQAGATFDAVKQRGFLQCGVNTGLAGFALPDSQGKWTGIDVDTCRAIAAAVFGDADKVKFTPLNAQVRFTALQSGEIDVLARNTTYSLSRDTSLGLTFTAINFYDGQGFMVNKSLGVSSAKDLNGATICVQPGTTTELNLTDWFRANKLDFKPVVIEKLEDVEAAFFSGRCDAYTTDASGLAGTRAAKAPKPEDYIILPEIISKEPLSIAVRQGDDQWADITRWVFMAQVQAEESGVTSQNIDSFADSPDPTIQRLLGKTPGMGEALGLPENWAYNAIKQVGNYGEMFERNVGEKTPLGLKRGLNALWTQGGLQYAIPIR